jgi:ribonuclease D
MISLLKDIASALKEHLILAEKLERTNKELELLKSDHDKLEENFTNFVEKVQTLLEKHFEIVKKEIQNVHNTEAKERKISLLEIENMILKSNQAPKNSVKKSVKGILTSKNESDKS